MMANIAMVKIYHLNLIQKFQLPWSISLRH